MTDFPTPRLVPGSKLIPFPVLASLTMPAQQLPRVVSRARVEPTPILAPKAAETTPAQDLAQAQALAHDARNALAALQLLGGMLSEPGVLAAEHAGLAGDLMQTTLRLSAMVTELAGVRQAVPLFTAAARAEAAALAKPAARPVAEVLAGCQRILQLTAGRSIAVHVSSESGLPAVALADANLERVLVNLVKNASEAMPDGGTVRITARRALSRTAPAVLVHVSDDGPGIPMHALEHIFKAGFSSKRHDRPWQVECGLGLTIVRQLLEAAGGAIEVASTRRRGTTFELRIPLHG